MRKIGRRPQRSASPADEDGDRQHHALGGDHAERQHRCRLFGKLERKLLPDQRQERRVGEVKKERETAKIISGRVWKRTPYPAAAPALGAVLSEVARAIVIDRLGGDHQHGGRGQGREDGHEQKDRRAARTE